MMPKPGDDQGKHVHRVVHHERTVEQLSDLRPELERGQHEHLSLVPETVLDRIAHCRHVAAGFDIDREHIGDVVLPVTFVGVHVHDDDARVGGVE